MAPEPGSVCRPVQIAGGYVEVNLSADNCITLIRRLLAFCGVDESTVMYEEG